MDTSKGGEPRPGVLLAFPSSNQNVRADLRALERAGLLTLFCTTIALGNSPLSGILPPTIRHELARRSFEGIPGARIKTFPWREAARLLATRLGLSGVARHEIGWASYDSVSQAFDREVARYIRRGKAPASAVYAYEYAALRIFKAAAERGMRRFYELPIGYWRAGLRIMTEEHERNPEWAPTIDLLKDSPRKQERKDVEIGSADHIIVPSEFVRGTLREHPSVTATVDVISYGAPRANPAAVAARGRATRLRLLYVGHLSQRKGLSYLFDAMRCLKGIATLTLVGQKPDNECAALEAELRQHNWLGTMPHARVLEVMAQHDVFVFPSLFEGLALVVLEAMAQGLPIITTVNSGATGAIEEGKEGFVVPIRDSDAIAAWVLELARDRERLDAMSTAALAKAERMSWAAREAAFVATLRRRLQWPGAWNEEHRAEVNPVA